MGYGWRVFIYRLSLLVGMLSLDREWGLCLYGGVGLRLVLWQRWRVVMVTCPYISHTPSCPIFPTTPSIISCTPSCPISPVIPSLHLHAHHPVSGSCDALSCWRVWSRAPENVSQLTCSAGYMSNRAPLCGVGLVDISHSRLHYKIVGSG